jgi:integrase
MLHTGLRIVDIARLERKAITVEDCPEAGGPGCGRLIVKPWKTRKRRLLPVNIPIPREIMEMLAALPIEGPYYFWSGGQIEAGIQKLRKSLTKLLKRAGATTNCDCTHVTPLTGPPKKAGPHTFRHTCARLLRDAGAEDEDAAAWLGHTVQTFRSFYCGETPATQRRRDAIRLKF